MRARNFIHSGISVLACFALAACASSGTPAAPRNDPSGEARAPTVLEHTTPAARRASADPAGRSSAQPSGSPVPDVQADGSGSPGRLLIYSAITGHVPLDDLSPQDLANRTPAEREAARAAALEKEIQQEIEKQEALRGKVEDQRSILRSAPKPATADPSAARSDSSAARSDSSAARAPDVPGAEARRTTLAEPPPPQRPPPQQAGIDLGELANPIKAPAAPKERELPASLFEEDRITIPAGHWQNKDPYTVLRRRLDVDNDGIPEQIRYYDPHTGKLVRKELDRNYDGIFDTWHIYENGELVQRIRDNDGEGTPDDWERYSRGRLAFRSVDRDNDGVKDAFYRYRGELLSERRHDANNDGKIDMVVFYENLHRARTEEDQNRDGVMDTWTTYRVVGGKEYIARVERDSRDRGEPDLIETFETVADESVLARREEDVDGDGTIDVISIYESGKLVQRQVSDAALSPL